MLPCTLQGASILFSPEFSHYCNSIYIFFDSIFMVYFMVLLNVPRTEIKAFLREFKNITDKYRKAVNANVSAIVIHPDLSNRISVLWTYVLTH